MFTFIRTTFKKLVSDNRGEDLTETSSGLSKAAKTAIALGVITGVAYGANSLTNTANKDSDEAASRVSRPVGVQAEQSGTQQSVFGR